MDINTALGSAAAGIAVVGGAYTTIRRFVLASKIKKEQYKEDILKQAKEEAERVKKSLEAKIFEIETELKNQKESVSKDLSHLKDVYNSEIKVLGQRIEELRQDLTSQHASLVALLTKLVDTK